MPEGPRENPRRGVGPGLACLLGLLLVPAARPQAPDFGDLSGPGEPPRAELARERTMPGKEDLHRLHRIMIRNDGELKTEGEERSSVEQVRQMFRTHIPGYFAWAGKPRILIHAHGGVVREQEGLKKIATFRTLFEPEGVYPVLFVWKSGIEETIGNIFADAMKVISGQGEKDPELAEVTSEGRGVRGLLDTDAVVEGVARHGGGKALWDEMKENAVLASTDEAGGARLVAEELIRLKGAYPDLEVHLTGHSAGSVFLGPFVQLLLAGGVPVRTLVLQSPACTTELFHRTMAPGIEAGQIERTILYNLSDEAEREDSVTMLYGKSILYMISNALEREAGTPILGMETAIRQDPRIMGLIHQEKLTVVLSPNNEPIGSPWAIYASDHIDLGSELSMLLATRKLVLGRDAPRAPSLEE